MSRRDAYGDQNDAHAAMIERLSRRLDELENQRTRQILAILGAPTSPTHVAATTWTRLTNGFNFTLEPRCRYLVTVRARAVTAITATVNMAELALYTGATDLTARFGGYHITLIPQAPAAGYYTSIYAEWLISGPTGGASETLTDFHPGLYTVNADVDVYTQGGTPPSIGSAGSTIATDSGLLAGANTTIEYLGRY